MIETSRLEGRESKDNSIQLDSNDGGYKINRYVMGLGEGKVAKVSNLKLEIPVRSQLGLAGQSILSNLSATNSQYSSI